MLRHAAVLATLVLAPLCTAQDDLWLTDFAAAKQKAKAEKKDLLIDFTGSDWCSWCIKLDKEVFTQAAFQAEAPKHFVLVKLDFPNDEKLITPELKKQNEQLRDQYAIEGYPTILLTDAEGRPYGQTGYQRGGAEAYNEHLAGFKKAGEAFRAAMQKASGTKDASRAKALDEAVAALDAELVSRYHVALLEEIVSLDADGKAGLKAKHEEALAKAKAAAIERKEQQELQQIAGEIREQLDPHVEAKEFAKAQGALDAMIKAPKSKTHHQLALFFKGMLIMEESKDAKAAIVHLEAAKALGAETPIGKQVGMILPQLKKMAEQGEKKDGGDGK